MEVHHHSHTSRKKWTNYLWEFVMLFLAVFCGFLAEYQLEHKIEKERAEKYLQSMLLDVRTNIKNLDSLLVQDHIIIDNHDSLVNWLLQDSATIDRGAFAKKMGAVWVRNFLVRKETYEQMRSSGSLRYIGNIDFLKRTMDYERITNFAQYRNQEFEKKYILSYLSRHFIKRMILLVSLILIPVIIQTLLRWKKSPGIMMC